MRRGLLVGMGLVLVGGMATPAVTPVNVDSAAAVPRTAMPFDFDGDGYADLAVGVPGEDLRGKRDAGAVQVLYGSATGPTARDQVWHQGRKGVKNKLERADRFGDALASADFNADGFADLAIGIPREDIGSVKDTGAVQVLYGGPRGLTAQDQVWHQGSRGVPGNNERGDGFGRTLAAGDFDGDGYADLVVSVVESVGSISGAGRVVVLRGSESGLTASRAQSWRQGDGGVPSQPGDGERFGAWLAVGDVNGDGCDDLAVVVANESDIPHPDDEPSGSAVHLLLGSPGGLAAAGTQYILPSDIGMTGGKYYQVAFGDFNRDGSDDLAMASADVFVVVLHGHTDGLHPAPLAAAGTPGADSQWRLPLIDDYHSEAVAAGDLTGDGYPDLAVGAKVILGTAQGLGAAFTDWSPWDSAKGQRAPIDRADYGAIVILPFSGGTHAWLAVNTFFNRPEPDYAGAVTVLQGIPSGAPGPATVWSQDSPGIRGAAEPGDSFGQVIGG